VGTTSGTSDKVTFASDGNSLNQLGLIALNDAASAQGFIQFRNSALTSIGNVTRVGTTNMVIYNTTSDHRLKTVAGAVTGQGARIDTLNPIDYLWTEGGQQARGFLAHEFQTVYPNSVTGTKDQVDADGKPVYQAMQAATSEVIADLVAEIQSLRTRLTALENK
jgi:ribulose kinase